MRISDWSSDVCSSDLVAAHHPRCVHRARAFRGISQVAGLGPEHPLDATEKAGGAWDISDRARRRQCLEPSLSRSEEHTSELQSLMRISYAVFCLKKKTHKQLRKNIVKSHYRYITKKRTLTTLHIQNNN